MKSRTTTASVLLAAILLLIPSWREASGQAQPTVASPPVYKPPTRGAPAGRVGGGTRGVEARDAFLLSALVPNHVGLTVSPQPSLYWFISKTTSLPIEVAIAGDKAVEPLLEARIPAPREPGVQKISLAELGVRLTPGVVYRWSVSVIPDPNRRSRDILAAGTIELVTPADDLKEKFAKARKEDLPSLYAEAGFWYDALAAVSELIVSAPQEPAFRKQRGALLSQVDLPEFEAAR